MKGLWLKDWLFLKTQWLAAALTFALALGALFIFKQTGIAVGMGITSLTMTFVMLATVTADQANHGISFLLTLPITASQYARQKFALLFGVVAGTIAVITGLSLIYCQLADWSLKTSTLVGYTVSIGLVIFLILGLSLAYQLRHGAEQAQVAMSITGGLVALLLGGGFAAVKYTNWGLQLWLKIVANYAEHGGIVIILILGLLSLLLAVFGSRYGKKLAQ
ncbi:ABC-2 transporter permease [Lacticaseibacillus manihotivorans]|jgi:hypothetical protein|uniref:Uncharacterized protein n=2 Tax=Lacticaseibacillus manihotivorans TaxID=88233 RepID=A0A0R1QI96_9LACO|nr:ABC-2 transporter permease [Lacticaseibacillus manihotivorans]KRL44348.1 hypothetical protein FD01_GL001180 [Lacticaseibacillus manihotivorans DSM 13343 = JCM 12514]QFQ91732.1 hypothetical protein LM010_09960 [Lacticaseibacillus manihotivorans]